MYYLVPTSDTFVVYYDKSFVPASLVNQVIEVETLPEGEGVLKRNTDGDFYREVIEREEITVEDRLEAIEQTSAYTQIQVEYLATLAEINNGL